jgi:hypothetical protein
LLEVKRGRHPAPDIKKVYIQPLWYSASDHLLRGVQATVQDLLKIINSLQDTAIGNCRKRLEDAAAKAKRSVGKDAQDEVKHPLIQKPSCGVTSVLKEKHGL